MSELLVLSNPRRRRKARKARKARSRRAHRKMSALQLKYFGGGRKHRSSRRRVRRSARRASAPVLANPSRRVKRRSSRRRSRGFVSMPSVGRILKSGTGSLSKPLSMIGPALTGAVGAVAVHAIAARLPIPAALVTGKVRYVTQGALAIGLGMVASRIPGVGAGVAAKMAEGSLTVTLAELIKEIATDNGVNLGGIGYYLNAPRGNMPNAGAAPARMGGMGLYLTGPGAGGSNVRTLRGLNAGRGMRGIGNSFKF